MIELDDSLVSWVRNLRRWFHHHPEPSFDEHKTQDKIVEILNGLGIENRRAGQTGVIADIRGNGTGRTDEPPMHCLTGASGANTDNRADVPDKAICVHQCPSVVSRSRRIALRADMDALRIQEAETSLNRDYRSENAGVMHACGHDGHMAILLGAARWLQEHRDKLAGNVRLIFQPAEEVPPGGAGRMIEAGCLDDVDAIIAVHIFGNMPLSRIGFRAGPFMAATRTFKVTIKGKPGHHMCPQDNIDPIQIAARFISTIQTDIRQRLSPNSRYVLGFGEVHSGMQHNQTPGEAKVVGTFRAYDVRDSETIAAAIRSNLDGLMLVYGRENGEGTTQTWGQTRAESDAGASSACPRPPSYTLDAEPAYPPLVNNPVFTKHAAEVLKAHFASVDDDMEPNLGGEDFACYVERVPGMFLFLGGGNPARGITAMNHSDRFDMDEAVLPTGIKVLLTVTTDFLHNPAPYLGE
ncbi:MAG TPA: amidohydrolase [bacterium]|nr:amidohydrolase [bacterium]